MTYEIPQQLEYEEKILFGLTLKQLAYALGFGTLSFIEFKTIPNKILAYSTIIPSVAIGAGFMFLDFEKYLKNFKNFFILKRAKILDEKMNKFIGLKRIEKDTAIIHQKNKYTIAILKIEPLNYSIKNKTDQEIIIKSFQKFLNSLDSNIQILMTTDKLCLDSYLQEMNKRIKKQNKKLFLQYRDFLLKTIQEIDTMDRSFYIIIKEKDNLKAQIETIKDQLDRIGLKNKQLTNIEIQKVFERFFTDPNVDKTPEAINKLTKENLLQYQISPLSITNEANHFKINDTINKIITAKGYPRNVEAGFLNRIITASGDFDISIHIEPYEIESTMIKLNKELQKQRADLYAEQNKEIINPSLEIQYEDTRRTLENLQKGDQKMFNISLYINCRANNLEKAEILAKKVQSELNSSMIIPAIPLFKMAQGIKSIIPVCNNELGLSRNITTDALSAFFPFTSKFLQVDQSGVWLGQNSNNIPIIKDIFTLTNPNGCILASSGAGKSYTAKLIIARQLLNGAKVIVVDPQSEYCMLTEKFNGQLINLSRKSKTIINPLDLMGHDYTEKRLALIDLFNIMLGGTSEPQKAILDRALTKTYEEKGINMNETTWNKTPPILGDLLHKLELMSKNATKVESETYRSLINRLSLYVDGVFSFLNRQTEIDFNNDFVCFNIGDMPKQVKPVIMFLVLDYVYMKMKKDKERKLLVIDEAWNLLQNQEEDSYIFEIVKTCRKFNLGLLLITQDVGDLLKSNAGMALLSNSSYTFLLRQKPAVIDVAEKVFHLSQSERETLLTAGKGEGILICENEHSEIKITASKEEDEIITTNPDVILKREKENEIETPKIEAIDENKKYYDKKELNQEQINYLISKGYQISSHVPLGETQRKDFLLKIPEGESDKHFFLVKAIEENLLQYTKDVKLFETRKPDIVFKANNKEWAFEIETGSQIKKNFPQFENKIELLKKEFKNNWLFVVTQADQVYTYSKFGKTYTRKNIQRKIRSIFSEK